MKETQAPPPTLHDLAAGYAGALTLHRKALDEKARALDAERRMHTDLALAQKNLGAQLGLELAKHVESEKRLHGPGTKVEFWQRVFDINEQHRAVLVSTYVNGDWFHQVTNREARA